MKVFQCLNWTQTCYSLEKDEELIASRLSKPELKVYTDNDGSITSTSVLTQEDREAKDWIVQLPETA